MSANGTKTIEQVGEIVGVEGLGYAIVDYLDASRIEDLELRQLWRDAQNALLKVDDFLKEKLGNDFFDGF
jgi:hypothetical protein